MAVESRQGPTVRGSTVIPSAAATTHTVEDWADLARRLNKIAAFGELTDPDPPPPGHHQRIIRCAICGRLIADHATLEWCYTDQRRT